MEGNSPWMISMSGELRTYDSPHVERLLRPGAGSSGAPDPSQYKLLCLQACAPCELHRM